VQSAALAGAVAYHWTPRAALLLAPPYLAFQLLAFFVADVLAREARAREELRAAQARLAETTRLAERLRISRELHDAVGHHLTALRLNLEALRRALDLGATDLVLRSDSRLLVEQLSGRWRVKNPTLIRLHQEARALAGQFHSVTFEHVRRERNREADRLANRALDERASKLD